MPQHRRTFLKLTATSALSFAPLVNLLGNEDGDDQSERYAEEIFNSKREVHYLDKNLANIYVYFINIVRKHKKYIPQDYSKSCYIIFSIPAQNLNERFYDKGVLEKDDIRAHLSGFSFLSFRLWSNAKSDHDKKIGVDIESLLDWNNENFHLITTGDLKTELFHRFDKVCDEISGVQKASVQESVTDTERNITVNNFYYYREILLKKLLASNNDDSYLSIIELPAKLFLAPHLSQPGWKTKFEMSRLEVKEYPLRAPKRMRTVQELWNTRLFFTNPAEGDAVNQKDAQAEFPPVFRILGFRGKITCDPKEPCKTEDPAVPEVFLPQLLDRAELTYLTQLGNPKYAGPDYDLKSEGDVVFSSLGATAKLHYKSLKTKEPVIDLVEYEHHFTLGRDEYIKVARIGVIAATGQKALHVRIARRRINKDNICFMEFHQYIELVEKQKDYEQGLAAQDIFPENYFSFSWHKNEAGDAVQNVPDPTTANPKFKTNYRRYPFRKISITEEIKDKPIVTCSIDKKYCPDTPGLNPKIFWVLNEADNTDFYLNGWYWDKDVKDNDLGKMEFAKPFSAPVLFIRKSVFVSCSAPAGIQTPITRKDFETKIFNFFVSDDNTERRRIRLFTKPLAFTPKADTEPGDESKPNSTNSPKTKFIEYYFDPKDWPSSKKQPVRDSDWFDEEYFPVYPQIKEAEIASDHAQEYTQQYYPIPVRYNEDYVYRAFNPLLKNGLNNKGRLIFDVLEGKAYAAYNDSKNVVNNVFKNATDKIGGIAIPDPKVEAISLRDNALQLPQKINQYASTKFVRILDIVKFDDICGLKAQDIFSEFVDLRDTPIYEVEKQLKQLQEKIDNFIQDFNNQAAEWIQLFRESEFIKMVIEKIKLVEKTVFNFKHDLDKLTTDFQTQFNTLKKLKEEFDNEFKSYQAILNAYKTFFDVERIKIFTDYANHNKFEDLIKQEVVLIGKDVFIQYRNDWTGEFYDKLKKKIDALANSNLKDALTKAVVLIHDQLPLIYDDSLNINKDRMRSLENYLRDTGKEFILDSLSFIKTNNLPLDKLSYESLIESINNTRLVLKKADKDALLRLYTQIYGGAVPQDFETEVKKYLVKCEKAKDDFEKDLNKKADVLLTNAISYLNTNLNTFREELVADGLYSEVLTIIEVIDNVKKLSPFYYYERYCQLYKDYQDQYRKLVELTKLFNPGTSLESVKAAFESQIDLLVADYRTKLKDYVDRYVADHLDDSLSPFFQDIKKYREEKVEDIIKDKVTALIKTKIADIAASQRTFNELKEKKRQAEKMLADYLKVQGGAYLDEVEKAVKETLDHLKTTLDIQTYKEYTQQALHFLEIIKTPKTKNLTFRWHTENFRDKNLGIISFKKGSGPSTILSVDVVTTIHYSLFRFPGVVDKITNKIESRLANFGIGFLNILIVDFREVSFVGGTDTPTKFEVKIAQVRFEGALSFVQAFESFLKTLGEGFRLELTPLNVGIGYTLPIPAIRTPSFNFFNLTLNFDFRIYFTRRPVTFTFSLAKQESKFGLTAGILGGFGFFSITAEPRRGITEIEMALEFGAFLGISLGPISGEVKLVAGIYYKKSDYEVILEGYILCEGTLRVWILSVSARIYLGMISRNSSIEGMCTVSYTVKLGFIKKSFSGTYRKQIKGAQNQNQASAPSISSLTAMHYANAFGNLNAIEEKYMTERFATQNEMHPYELADFDDFKTYYEAFIG